MNQTQFSKTTAILQIAVLLTLVSSISFAIVYFLNAIVGFLISIVLAAIPIIVFLAFSPKIYTRLRTGETNLTRSGFCEGIFSILSGLWFLSFIFISQSTIEELIEYPFGIPWIFMAILWLVVGSLEVLIGIVARTDDRKPALVEGS